MKYQEQNHILKRWIFVDVCTCRTDVQLCGSIFVTMQLKKTVKIWGDSRCPTLFILEFSSVAQGHLQLVPLRLCGVTPVSTEFSAAVLSHFPLDALRLHSDHYPITLTQNLIVARDQPLGWGRKRQKKLVGRLVLIRKLSAAWIW